jgi:hypothetical protein
MEAVLTSLRRSKVSDGGAGLWLQRQCACGQHTGGGECESCRKKLRDPFARPQKSVGVTPEDDSEERPSPRQGDATIQCNGSGGYELIYGTWGGATCGTKNCVTAHESSHMADWQAKWPKGCAGQAKGYLPKGHPPDDPLISRAEYKTFLKDSECRAHTADLDCAKGLPKTAACKKTVEDYIDLTAKQRANFCTGLSTKAKLGILAGGTALGALAGYGLSGGSGLGTAIGAGVGFLGGVVTDLLS